MFFFYPGAGRFDHVGAQQVLSPGHGSSKKKSKFVCEEMILHPGAGRFVGAHLVLLA